MKSVEGSQSEAEVGAVSGSQKIVLLSKIQFGFEVVSGGQVILATKGYVLAQNKHQWYDEENGNLKTSMFAISINKRIFSLTINNVDKSEANRVHGPEVNELAD